MERNSPVQTSEFEQNHYESEASNLTGLADTGDKKAERSKAELPKRTANRGFAAMDSEKQKRIAREGGRAAHRQGVAHEWSRDEAREAGKKGGEMVSRNREHMSEIGRKGGQSSGLSRQRSEG